MAGRPQDPGLGRGPRPDRGAAARAPRGGPADAREFNERLDKAYAAKTVGDLDELLADLPGIDLYQLPHASLPRYQDAAGRSRRAAGSGPGGAGRAVLAGVAVRLGQWASLTLVTFLVWLGTGAGFPWFLWSPGPSASSCWPAGWAGRRTMASGGGPSRARFAIWARVA